MSDIVVDNCAICRNHIMDLCECTVSSWRTSWDILARIDELLVGRTRVQAHAVLQVSTARRTRARTARVSAQRRSSLGRCRWLDMGICADGLYRLHCRLGCLQRTLSQLPEAAFARRVFNLLPPPPMARWPS